MTREERPSVVDVLPKRLRLIAAVLAVPLAACARITTAEAPQDATLSNAPNAPGYLVVGLAHTPRNSDNNQDLYPSVLDFKLTSRRGEQALMRLRNCVGLLAGSCPPLTSTTRQVLRLSPGDWTVSSVLERRHRFLGYGDRFETLTIRPRSLGVRVEPGSLVYIGDFVFDFDFAEQAITLARYERNDAGAAAAVARYPNLKGSIQYRSLARQRVAQN